MTLRKAKQKDVPTLVALGEVMFDESQFSQYDFNKLKTARLLKGLIANKDGIVLVYTTSEDGIIGAFVGGITQHFFGDCIMSYDYGLFVLPEFRNSRAGLALLKGYIKEAKDLGVDEINIANSTGVESERVEQLFLHSGLTRIGGIYKMKGN